MIDLKSIIRWCLPPFEDKVAYKPNNMVCFLMPIPVLLLQVHLLVRYDPIKSLPLRLALIPIVAVLAIKVGFGFYFDSEGVGQLHGRAQHFNMGGGVYGVYATLRAIQWGTMWDRPRLKNAAPTNVKRKGYKLPFFFPGSWTPIEIDLLANMRANGWASGSSLAPASLPVPRYTLSQRLVWILHRVKVFLILYTLIDVLDALVKDVRINPTALRTLGSSIWAARDGLFGEFGPYLIALVYGTMVFLTIQAGNCFLSICAVGLLGDLPSRWEPLPLNEPWKATSLKDMWSNRWHHMFRESFMYLAFRPVRYLTRPILGRKLSKASAVMAVFVLSAYMHHLGQLPLDDFELSWMSGTAVFFFIQGVATLLEELWEEVTGIKVQGIWGWVWTFTVMTLSGTLPSEDWAQRGVGSSYVCSPKWTHPFVYRIVGFLGALAQGKAA